MILTEIYQIRGSSNLSVDNIYNCCIKDACVFSLSNNVLPYNRVCNKEDLVNSSNLLSVFFNVLRRVYQSSLSIGQWRRKCEVDSISKPQLQIWFKQSWKLCLNLCSCKRFIPLCNHLISRIPLELLQSKALLGKGLINFRILFLKSAKLFEFRRVGSNLFHSIIEEGEKVFEEVVSDFRTGNVINISCSIWKVFSGISLKNIGDFCFCKFCKTFLVFCTNIVTEVILNLILGKVFP